MAAVFWALLSLSAMRMRMRVILTRDSVRSAGAAGSMGGKFTCEPAWAIDRGRHRWREHRVCPREKAVHGEVTAGQCVGQEKKVVDALLLTSYGLQSTQLRRQDCGRYCCGAAPWRCTQGIPTLRCVLFAYSTATLGRVHRYGLDVASSFKVPNRRSIRSPNPTQCAALAFCPGSGGGGPGCDLGGEAFSG